MKPNIGKGFFLGLIVLATVLVIAVPLAIIWSLNTLFPILAIPYSVWSWLAVVILFSAVRANTTLKR